MSNVETDPVELTCQEHPSVVADPWRPEVEVLTAREVPLGGLRAMTVRRTLPQRKRSLIGAFTKLDITSRNQLDRVLPSDPATVPPR